MAKILIVAKGTYGDMFPIYAVAQLLKGRGHSLTIATSASHKDAVLGMGFDVLVVDEPAPAAARGSSNGWLNKARLPVTVVRMLKFFSIKSIETEYEKLLPAARDAELMIGNQLAYTGSIVREKLGKPWVYCVASPLVLPTSYKAPPLFPYLHGAQIFFMGSESMQRLYVWLGRGIFRLFMSNFTSYRKRLGLDASRHPTFEAMFSDQLNLFMMSPELIERQPDWTSHSLLTGFTWFEPEFMQDAGKIARLNSFVESGSPPVIFTLGGDKRAYPGAFFQESKRACELLGVRGIFVAAERFHDKLPNDDTFLTTGYLPYSILLKRAQAVVHSGGIGTIGWCIRYRVPSLLVPTSLDQFDNAYRATREGFADTMSQRNYRAENIASALKKLLGDIEIKARLEHVSDTLAAENGAGLACDAIEELLARNRKNRRDE